FEQEMLSADASGKILIKGIAIRQDHDLHALLRGDRLYDGDIVKRICLGVEFSDNHFSRNDLYQSDIIRHVTILQSFLNKQAVDSISKIKPCQAQE
ncbi:MAG: hypothetical protein II737_04145, partial [Mailhella sp.]|nr:hypothetical protein [Mailhella sp.]